MPYSTYTIPVSSSESYQGLGHQDDIHYNGATRSAGAEIVLLTAWLYLSGSQPVGRTNAVKGSGAGTKFIMQIVPDDDAPGYHFVRVILLEGASVTVSRLDGSDAHVISQTGKYIDARVYETNNTIVSWQGPTTFDPDSTPGSEGLMADVNSAKAATGVP